MGPTGALKFLTDFFDQAVVLPLVFAVAVVLAVQGWRRGALVWLGTIGAAFTVMLALKLFFLGCAALFGSAGLHSPSGHVAAASVVCGGLAAIYGASRRTVATVAGLAAGLIAITRLGLEVHSWPEVLLGTAIGLAGALGMARAAGPPPPLRLRPMVLTATFILALLHGRHLEAEIAIRQAAFGAEWLPAWCHTGTNQP